MSNIFSRSVMWATVFSAIAAVVCAVSSDRSLEDKGRVELQRVRDLSQQPRYGECWSRALEKIQSSCREFSDDVQSKIALSFTHCHLQRSTAHCTGTSLKFAGLQWFAVTPNRPDGETSEPVCLSLNSSIFSSVEKMFYFGLDQWFSTTFASGLRFYLPTYLSVLFYLK